MVVKISRHHYTECPRPQQYFIRQLGITYALPSLFLTPVLGFCLFAGDVSTSEY
jgi:hypothetical protein